MKTYAAVLGRQPLISVAELESLYEDVKLVAPSLAEFTVADGREPYSITRLGGTQKIAELIEEPLPKFWRKLPAEGKIVLGISDFTKKTNPYIAQREALRWKREIKKTGRNVRVIPNQTAVLSSATSWHNRLFTDTHIELLKNGNKYYRVIEVQDIDDYVQRDQKRPARDARVGMLPPKLAQILINLCGDLPAGSRLLDPFCGTGVVLQEGVLMGYLAQGTDLSEKMVDYTTRNLCWLEKVRGLAPSCSSREDRGVDMLIAGPLRTAQAKSLWSATSISTPRPVLITHGDARNFQWEKPIDLVTCETYLGPPMSLAPTEIKLKEAKIECRGIILGFLKNLAGQIKEGTPVVIAVPAWLRPDRHYEHLNILDEIENLRYNVVRFKNLGQKDLLYHRDGQVVAREIIVLRKK